MVARAAPGHPRGRRLRPWAGRPVLATAARAGLDAALIGLGVLALWELRRYSAAPRLSGARSASTRSWPVAPAVALARISLLPLRYPARRGAPARRAEQPRRRLAGALAGWQIQQARGPGRKPGAARGSWPWRPARWCWPSTSSWRQSQLDQAAFATGADVTVSLAAPLPVSRGGAIAQAPGVPHRHAGRP